MKHSMALLILILLHCIYMYPVVTHMCYMIQKDHEQVSGGTLVLTTVWT